MIERTIRTGPHGLDLAVVGWNTGAPGVTLSGGNSRRVLGVSSGVVVGLRGLTIRDGLAGYGGGILNAGILTLNNTALLNNNSGTSGGGPAYIILSL